MKILIEYPSPAKESEIVLRHGIDPPEASQALDTGALLGLQDAADAVAADHGTLQYAVDLVHATRDPARYGLPDLVEYLSYRASPRATPRPVPPRRAPAL